MTGETLVDLLAASVEREPGAPALIGPDQQLTYAQLWERADRIGANLRSTLPAGSRIGVHVGDPVAAITTMVACLTAGLPYVPVDPTTPPVRARAILDGCGARAYVAPTDVLKSIEASPMALIATDGRGDDRYRTLESRSAHRSGERSIQPGGEDEAYILYTSGSTGRPKGARISHGNAVAFVDWAIERLEISPGDRLPVCSSLAWDLAVLDVFAGLAAGAAICPVDGATMRLPRRLRAHLEHHSISVLYAVPQVYLMLLEGRALDRPLPNLRLGLFAGEVFPIGSLRKLARTLPHVRFFNLYGPIETNVVVAHEVTERDLDLGEVPIGRPVPGTSVVLSDPARSSSTGGGAGAASVTKGEIVVTGPTVFLGYAHEGDLPEDCAGAVGLPRTFRTGDRARILPTGDLIFTDRRDGLIKVDGYRVELGDVESVASSAPGVRHAAAAAHVGPDGHTSLGLLVRFGPEVRDHAAAAADVRRWFVDHTPTFMIPSVVVAVEEMPTNDRGKIDRSAVAARLFEAVPGHAPDGPIGSNGS